MSCVVGCSCGSDLACCCSGVGRLYFSSRHLSPKLCFIYESELKTGGAGPPSWPVRPRPEAQKRSGIQTLRILEGKQRGTVGVSILDQQLRNPTSTHEDTSSIPGLYQGVTDPVLL